METTRLGRTGLIVSRMGIGAGGPSQLGRRTGLDKAASADLLRRAFDAGVNFVDSSEGYGTEPIIGHALKGRDRAAVVISTKKSTRHQQVTAQSVWDSLEQSLLRLGTDYIDIYNLHGVVPQDYDYLAAEIYPVLAEARQQGKIRFVGITEMFNEDLGHTMLQKALEDDLWDVLMVGFNILNQTARDKVLQRAIAQDVGIQVMFAVRKALRSPENLQDFIDDLIGQGQVASEMSAATITDFLLKGAESLPDAAYRFCREEPGVHVVLSGTGNAKHLQANLASFARPPLPEGDIKKLKQIFAKVDSTTGQ